MFSAGSKKFEQSATSRQGKAAAVVTKFRMIRRGELFTYAQKEEAA